MATCEVCGQVCKDQRGLAAHMRQHKTEHADAVTFGNIKDIVKLLQSTDSQSEEGQQLLKQAQEYELTLKLISAKVSVDLINRLEKLKEVRNRLDDKLVEVINNKLNDNALQSPEILKQHISFISQEIANIGNMLSSFMKSDGTSIGDTYLSDNIQILNNQKLTLIKENNEKGVFSTPADRQQVLKVIDACRKELNNLIEKPESKGTSSQDSDEQ